MDAMRAKAYRYIIYWALLEIRGLSWFAWRTRDRWNPFFLMRSIPYIRASGAVAEWLHNIAHFSANDFAGFEETWFWSEYDGMRAKHGSLWRYDYRKIFDEHLAGLQKKTDT